MEPTNPYHFQGKLITTAKNIPNIEQICKELYKQSFIKGKNFFIRSYNSKQDSILKISQYISKDSKFNIIKAQNKIAESFTDGFVIPTFKIHEYLKHKPLPLSAQKQDFLVTLSSMNNQKLNGLENIYIEQTGYFKNLSNLSTNLASQFATHLHFNNFSSLTIGESEIEDITTKKAYGEAILQVSHLKHHKLDLDLSLRIHKEKNNIISQKLNQKVKNHQFCFNLPYNLNNHQLSPHGFIVYLKGIISPEKIIEILSQSSFQAFSGITITTGIANGKIKTLTKIEKTENFIQESIGNFIYDPNYKKLKNGSWHSDQIGEINKLEGETVIILFPVLQSFYIKSK